MISVGVGGWIACGVSVSGVWMRGAPCSLENSSVNIVAATKKWAAFYPVAVTQLSEGSYLAGWDVALSNNQAFSCKYTPHGETPEGVSPQPESQMPVLILNGDVDPIDPPENMAGAKALWPNSRSLIVPYQSHSISDMNVISCWFSILNEFIQSGSAERLNTSCMQSIQPPPFLVLPP
jgi:pimeloyl-ACP methyl ester carboxylesterase